MWKLDRLGRSLPHLLEVVGDLEGRGIQFKSLQETIDTSTPGGKLVFHVFCSLAEFERDLIRERTNAGLAAARARGLLVGVFQQNRRRAAIVQRRSELPLLALFGRIAISQATSSRYRAPIRLRRLRRLANTLFSTS